MDLIGHSFKFTKYFKCTIVKGLKLSYLKISSYPFKNTLGGKKRVGEDGTGEGGGER